MKPSLLWIIFCFPSLLIGQSLGEQSIDKKQANETAIMNWLIELNEKGVEITEDSVKVSKEYTKVLNDEAYRTIVFPKIYTWEQTVQFIQKQELKQAFWFLINLYPQSEQNKELVIKSVITYDKLFKMDELMVNAFYTYSFLDSETSIIKDGKPETVRPDILEEKLRNVKEIVGYINNYRKQQEAQE